MNPKTRIKVDRLKLIDALKARKADAAATYATELATYKAQKAEYPKAVVAFLLDLAKQVKAGTLEPHRAMDTYCWRDSRPETPDRPREPNKYDQAIAQLEMSHEVDIAITAEDFAAYIK